MNKKILISLGVIAVVAAIAIGGTVAYFSQTEKAAITFTSGTVDLQLSKDYGASWHNGLFFNLPNNWAPGDTYSIEVWTRNMGRSGLANLYVTGNSLAGTPDKRLSDVIHITKTGYTDRNPDTGGHMWVYPPVSYWDGTNKFGNGNGTFTLRELASPTGSDPWMKFCWGNCTTHGDYLPANGGMIQKFLIEFTFDKNAGNEYQDNTVSFNLVFLGTDEPFTPVWIPE